jgi:hypothetical protein
VDPVQRQPKLKDAVAALDALKPSMKAMAERHGQLTEDDHRRVREASLRQGESLPMRCKCTPAPAVDVIGLFRLLPSPTLGAMSRNNATVTFQALQFKSALQPA